MEGLDTVHFSRQAEFAAIKADHERFEQKAYAYEQTNKFHRSLLSPEHSPPAVTPTPMKPISFIQSSKVSSTSKSRTALIRLPEHVRQFEYFPYQLSPELIVEIFAWCSPHDLVVLQGVSRDIKAILDRNGRLCWTRARHNLVQMPEPPFRPDYSSWNACEVSFTKFCFNSAHTPCFCCGRPVENALPHLIYRIQVCSRRICRDNLVLEQQFYIFSDDPQDPLYQKYKAIIPLLSYYLSPERQKLFLLHHAKNELAWYHTFKDTGDEAILQEIMEEKIELRRVLGKHAKKPKIAIMETERLNYKIALSTPMIRRTLRVFNLHLTCMTVTGDQESIPDGIHGIRLAERRRQSQGLTKARGY
ncbi:hypothetical protein IW262DRAFT_1514651 [Armillaria fumosa]|nr:hypothetical protein IW262DRAFT_1514651 [Armillaria fumosa]